MAKILHIDDEGDIRNLVNDALTPLGHEVLKAAHGLEGLEILASTPDINLVLLDNNHKHPDIDGYLTARRIREDPAYALYKDIPIIGLSDSFPDVAVPLLSAYLKKPFLPSELKAQINLFCKK